jgi:sugar lactone lactonase YvrE
MTDGESFVITWTARAVAPYASRLGEGPAWDAQREELLWVDILAGLLHRARYSDGGLSMRSTLSAGRHLGAAVPVAGPDGGWLLAAGQGFAHLAEDGAVTLLAQPEADRSGVVRMNDGACDPQGRFWAGSMAYDTTPGAGSLYCLDLDGSLRTVLTGATISNGLGWSPDGSTMYYADSGEGTVSAFDFDQATGQIERSRTLIRIASVEGCPDGLTVDDGGHLWVAIWGAGEVRRYTPEGHQAGTVRLPASQPSSCCFGGPDRSTLFITSAREGLDDGALAREGSAGRVFHVPNVGVTGPAAFPYCGRLRPLGGVATAAPGAGGER